MKKSKHREYHAGEVIALMSGTIAAVLGLLVLIGWVLRLPLLTSFGADLVPMAPSSALLVLMFGAALASRVLFPERRFIYLCSIVVGSIVSIIALLLFFFSSTGIHSNIEHLGFSITGSLGGIAIGYRSPVSAVCFFLSALSFLLILSTFIEESKRSLIAFVLAALVILISLLFLIAYLFASPLMYGGGIIPPSLPVSLAFLVLATGLLVNAGSQVWRHGRMKDEVTARVSIMFYLIFTLLAAGILTGGYFAYRNYEQNYRTEVAHQLSAITKLKVDQLVQWRKERLGDANVFYGNNEFSALVRRYFKNQADADAIRSIRTWMSKIATAYAYNRICLHDLTGTERISFPEGNIHKPAVFSLSSAEIIKSGKVVFQDFYRDENDGKAYLAVFVPVLDGHDNSHVLGILMLRIDPRQYLYPMLEKWPTPSESSETLLVRGDGNDALFLNDLKFYKDAALRLRIPLEKKDVLAVKAVSGREGVVEGVDYRGVPVIGEVRAVPKSPWFLVARMDTSEVYTPLRERLRLMIILVGALLAGAGAGVSLIWRHQKSRFYRDQYQSKEALREANDYLDNLFDHANAPIIVWDPQFRINRFNHAFETLTGSLSGDVIGKPLEILFPPAFVESTMALIKKTTGSERRETVEIPILCREGSVRTLLWNSATIFTPDGRTPVATIAQGQDITERKQAEEGGRRLLEQGERSRRALLSILEDRKKAEEEVRTLNAELERRVRDRTAQLEAANRELEAFSYSVSHDLRSPLRGIDGWSLALVEDYGGRLDIKGAEYLGRIRHETKRMDHLIDDMLHLSRIARAELRLQTVDLTGLSQRIAERLMEANRGRSVIFEAEPGLLAEGDPDLIEIMLTNLITNAWKFTGRREEARISLSRTREGFCIRDNGVGFDMKYADKMFIPFQRLHRQSEFPGSGIGLAIVQRIAARHGGRVWAEAEPEKGAAIHFTIGGDA